MYGLFYILIHVHVGGGLEGPGIESWWGRDYPHPPRPALGPNQPPIKWVPGLSWDKAAGVWCQPPTSI
jgi:hypothetical protein